MLSKIREVFTSFKFYVGLFGAYGAYLTTNVVAFADVSSDSANANQQYQNYLGSYSSNNALADIFNNVIAPLQGLGTVLAVIFAVICGIKLAASGVTGDPRGRTSAIIGLAFVVVGEVVIINARAVVQMAVKGVNPVK